MANKVSSPKGSCLLLLLVVSNLLLCKSVSSMSVCPYGDGKCQVPLWEMFQRAIHVANYFHILAAETFSEFEKHYGLGQEFMTMAMNNCHTASISTPHTKEEAQKLDTENLLKIIFQLLRSWKDPLNHLVSEVQGVQGITNSISSKTKAIEEESKRLLEGVEKIIDQVEPGVKESESYSVWLGLPSLQTTDEDSRRLGFYTVFFCMRRDSSKINSFFKLLYCRIFFQNNC
ncbi:PREDICTED: prolactin-like [Elephantulus edwardii]|uniref:prolactin-like n=1 Tax=Elephantulus edwardii TaxID=28737 RepID=UPI0003F0CD52|nr:PREDICTED: prolactin-like [Elephantulus edwardii]